MWPLYNVLLEKYRLKDSEAKVLSDFLMCMLHWRPKDRWSARELLDHPWLAMQDNYNVWMSREQLREFKIVNREQFPGYIEKLRYENQKKLHKKQQAEVKRLEKRKQELENQINGTNSSESSSYES